MKPYKYLLSLFVIAGLFLPAYAADNAAAPEAPSKLSEAKPDDLANFVLEKAKLYSEKGEAAVAMAVDVLTREAPAVVEEFLRWRSVRALTCGVLPLVCFITMLALALHGWFGVVRFNKMHEEMCAAYNCKSGWAEGMARTLKEVTKEAGNWRFGCAMIGTILGAISLLVLLIGGLPCLMEFVQIQIAPRVYLLENAVALLR